MTPTRSPFALWSHALALMAVLTSLGCVEGACDPVCWSDCRTSVRLTTCDELCPSGTSPTQPACEDGGATDAGSCVASCWSDCDSSFDVPCADACPPGSSPTPPMCVDAGADAGTSDAGTSDAGADGGMGDAGPPPSSCADYTDAQMMAAVYGGPKVPAGFYSEPPETSAGPQWFTPCSPDLATTRANADARYGTAALTGAERTTAQFHEVDANVSGTYTVHYRNDRCDYYDGAVLAGAPHAGPGALQGLAGYRWWGQQHNLGGAHILGAISSVGSATHQVRLCHVQTVYGDFGLCDEITLLEREHRVMVTGEVSIEADVGLRTITGTCR